MRVFKRSGIAACAQNMRRFNDLAVPAVASEITLAEPAGAGKHRRMNYPVMVNRGNSLDSGSRDPARPCRNLNPSQSPKVGLDPSLNPGLDPKLDLRLDPRLDPRLVPSSEPSLRENPDVPIRASQRPPESNFPARRQPAACGARPRRSRLTSKSSKGGFAGSGPSSPRPRAGSWSWRAGPRQTFCSTS